MTTGKVVLRAFSGEGEELAESVKGAPRFVVTLANGEERTITNDLGADLTAEDVAALCQKMQVARLEARGIEGDVRKAVEEAGVECATTALNEEPIFVKGQEEGALRAVLGSWEGGEGLVAVVKNVAGTRLLVDWIFPNRLRVEGDPKAYPSDGLIAALQGFGCAECVMECTALTKEGATLLTAFDLVSVDGQSLADQPYVHRVNALKGIFPAEQAPEAAVRFACPDITFMRLESAADLPDAALALRKEVQGGAALVFDAAQSYPVSDGERRMALYAGRVQKKTLRERVGTAFEVMRKLGGG